MEFKTMLNYEAPKTLGFLSRKALERKIGLIMDQTHVAADAYFMNDSVESVGEYASVYKRLLNGYAKLHRDEDDDVLVTFQVVVANNLVIVSPIIQIIEEVKK